MKQSPSERGYRAPVSDPHFLPAHRFRLPLASFADARPPSHASTDPSFLSMLLLPVAKQAPGSVARKPDGFWVTCLRGPVFKAQGLLLRGAPAQELWTCYCSPSLPNVEVMGARGGTPGPPESALPTAGGMLAAKSWQRRNPTSDSETLVSPPAWQSRRVHFPVLTRTFSTAFEACYLYAQ